MKLTNTFIRGVMNKDLDERLLPDGQYRDAWNVEVSASEGAGVGAIENILGNTNVSGLTLTANAKTIGAIADEANYCIYWFVADTAFDYVFRYNEITGVTATLLKDTKAVDPVLNFDSGYLITGVNIIDDLLFWTDNLNPPRRLNVKRHYAPDGFIEDDISVIVKPPLDAPTITLGLSPTVFEDNNLRDKFLMFSYRYKYENDEYSAISPFSATAFQPGGFRLIIQDDNFPSMQNQYSEVTISVSIDGALDSGVWVPNERIKAVQVLFKDVAQTNLYIIESFNMEDLYNPADGIFLPITGDYDLTFANNKIYTSLPPDEITRLFDNVPLKAKAQELIGSRIAYGNYVQFYDVTDSAGSLIEIDYTIELLDINIYNASTEILGDPLPTFRSDRDYEIGIAYLDEEGRMTTVLTSNTNTINIPPTSSVRSNDLQVVINNLPPSFATKYRLFIKQAKGDYYNIFPFFNYRVNEHVWFYILRAEIDKLKIGDYIICKAASSSGAHPTGATLSNKQYKILELKTMVGGGVATNSPFGVYFSIRVEDQLMFTGLDVYNESWDAAGYSSFGEKTNAGGWGACPYIVGLDMLEGHGVANHPIYYGASITHGVITPYFAAQAAGKPLGNQNIYSVGQDYRLRIKITPSAGNISTYKVQSVTVTATGLSSTDLPVTTAALSPVTTTIPTITTNEIHSIYDVSGTNIIYQFYWPLPAGYTTGDYWVVNIHSNGGKNLGGHNTYWHQIGGNTHFQSAVLPGVGWDTGQYSIPQVGYGPTNDRRMYPGARIEINITEANGRWHLPQFQFHSPNSFTNPGSFANIEEWFYESGAAATFYNVAPIGQALIGSTPNQDFGGKKVFFRRGFSYQSQVNCGGCMPKEGTRIQQQAGSHGNYENWSHYLQDSTVYMCIKGMGRGQPKSAGNAVQTQIIAATNPYDYCRSRGWIHVDFKINQQEAVINFETIPEENDPDIYYELNETFDIAGGLHQGNSQNQTATGVPARVKLNKAAYPGAGDPDIENSNYNAYAFGNGVEGLRIRGDFNAAALSYSPRASSPIEDYQEQHVEEAITYSGIYRENTGINNLNEFNLSLANFKYLDKFFGSIQKLHARDTDLIAFQENKVSKILYGKNLLSDAVGGGSIASIPEVLGTQISFAGEYGISSNPESFATWGNDMYFTDMRRGAVMRLGGNGMFEISSQGMKDWFKDIFQGISTQKIGVIDPFKERYVLAHNDTLSVPCYGLAYIKAPGFNVGNAAITYDAAQIFSNTDWAITLIDTGDGTTWLTINGAAAPYSGENNEVVSFTFAVNSSGSSRTLTVRFTACGVDTDYTAFQSPITVLEVVIMVVNNDDDGDLVATQDYDFTTNPTGGDIIFTDTPFTRSGVSLRNAYRNFPGLESVPTPGDTVDLKSEEAGTTKQKPFTPNLGNAMGYYVTDTLYGVDDIAIVLGKITTPAPVLAAGTYTSSFTYSRPAAEKYLYLVWDYRNNNTAGDTLTLASGMTGTTRANIDYDERRGTVSVGYNANATNNRFILKWGSGIVADSGSVAGAGTLTFFKSASTPTTIQLEVEIPSGGVDDGWTVTTSATSLTSFLIDLNDDDLSTVCARVPATTHYHSGAAALPVIGDMIFTTAAGEVAYDGNRALHKIGAGNDYVGVNDSGIVTSTGDCSACAEVAIPVISTPSLTLSEGETMDFQLLATNNPVSWAIITTCLTYDMAGGADGAVFTTTDCVTGDTITTIVSRNSTVTLCSTSSPVVVSGTGTSSSPGTCDDSVLPPGVTLDKTAGVITGIAQVPGVYSVTFTATNCFGTSVNTAVAITVLPLTTMRRFNMDTANPTATSVLACAVTPAYGILYHTGEGDYPIVNDFVFEACDCEFKTYNGGYLWYVTDELTVGKNNVLRIDSTGQVVDKVTCP